MKYIFLFHIVLLVQIVQAQTYNLTVIVTNIKILKGEIKIGVYNNKASFPHKENINKSLVLKVNRPSETFALKDLLKGEYAIALFHGKNADGICNTNFLGIREEAYGFSNNYNGQSIYTNDLFRILILEVKL